MESCSINCLACGANVNVSSGTKFTVCEYCGCELHFSPKSAILSDWIDNLKLSEVDKQFLAKTCINININMENLLFYKVYDLAYQLIKVVPQRWEGYFYAAVGGFWFGAKNLKNPESYFINLKEVFDNLKKCRSLCEDLKPIIEFEHEITENISKVALQISDSGFTGENIRISFQIFQMARDLQSENDVLKTSLNTYCLSLYYWTLKKLEFQYENEGKNYIPPEVYLEYLYYLWKYFGLSQSLTSYVKFAKLYVKNSSNSEYIEDVRKKLIDFEEQDIENSSKSVLKKIKNLFS